MEHYLTLEEYLAVRSPDHELRRECMDIISIAFWLKARIFRLDRTDIHIHIPTDGVSAFFLSLATCETTSGDTINNVIFLSPEE